MIGWSIYDDSEKFSTNIGLLFLILHFYTLFPIKPKIFTILRCFSLKWCIETPLELHFWTVLQILQVPKFVLFLLIQKAKFYENVPENSFNN